MRPSEVTDLDQGGFGPRQPRERRQLVGCSLSGVPLWVFFFFATPDGSWDFPDQDLNLHPLQGKHRLSHWL